MISQDVKLLKLTTEELDLLVLLLEYMNNENLFDMVCDQIDFDLLYEKIYDKQQQV